MKLVFTISPNAGARRKQRYRHVSALDEKKSISFLPFASQGTVKSLWKVPTFSGSSVLANIETMVLTVPCSSAAESAFDNKQSLQDPCSGECCAFLKSDNFYGDVLP